MFFFGAFCSHCSLKYADEIPVEDQGGFSNLPDDWPSRGAIEMDNVALRYAPGLPLSLRGLSLSVCLSFLFLLLHSCVLWGRLSLASALASLGVREPASRLWQLRCFGCERLKRE